MPNIDPLLNARIGIAIIYGRPYYRFSTYLKTLDLAFDSILAEEILDYSGNLIFTTRDESPKECQKPLLHEDIFEHPPNCYQRKNDAKIVLQF